MVLQRHTRGEGVEIPIYFQGMADTDYEAGVFDRVAKEAMEQIFRYEPFKSFRDCFDVVCTRTVRKKRSDGLNLIGEGTSQTEIEGYKRIGMDIRLNLSTGLFHSHETCISIPENYMTDNPKTIIHEFAHLFGILADEYPYYGKGKTNPDAGKTEKVKMCGASDQYGNFDGYYAWNVSNTDDPEYVPWSKFLKLEQYKDQIGIYEGAHHYEFGAYRPSYNSIMECTGDTFNAPSRYAIFCEIMKRSKLMGEFGTLESNVYSEETEEMLWELFLNMTRRICNGNTMQGESDITPKKHLDKTVIIKIYIYRFI